MGVVGEPWRPGVKGAVAVPAVPRIGCRQPVPKFRVLDGLRFRVWDGLRFRV